MVIPESTTPVRRLPVACKLIEAQAIGRLCQEGEYWMESRLRIWGGTDCEHGLSRLRLCAAHGLNGPFAMGVTSDKLRYRKATQTRHLMSGLNSRGEFDENTSG
jgi:hypothetical protein